MRYTLALTLFISLFSALLPQIIVAQEHTSCNGVDLTLDLDSLVQAEITRQAAATPNNKGRFWKIEKPGTPPSWLMGTMHLPDERISQLSATEQAAFAEATMVALELEEIVSDDPASMFFGLMHDHLERFTYPPGQSLQDSISPQQLTLLQAALKERGLSYAVLARTKPWIIWIMLSIPPCTAAQAANGQPEFDSYLGRQAQNAGKAVTGLETIDEQLTAIDSLPADFYVTSIIRLIALKGQLANYQATMIALYLRGEMGAIMPTMMALMERDLEQQGLSSAEMNSKADMLSFETILLDERNAVMANRAAPLLEKGNVFIAVGALHLVGENGLVEYFRRMGYKVTPG